MTQKEEFESTTPAISSKELLRNIFELCEATEDLDTNMPNDFLRGRQFEAKRIRNAIGNWFQDEENRRR